MKTTVYNTEIEINYMNAEFAGYGHYKVTAEVLYNGKSKTFSHTTNNVKSIDEAKEVGAEQGSEAKYKVLWGIVEASIEDEILEFIDDVDQA